MAFDPNQPPPTTTPPAPSPFARRIRRSLMAATVVALLILTALAIYGAFLGAQRASDFFNSPPLIAFWTAFTVLLLIGLAAFPRLVRRPGALAMHAGAVLILLGAMWGSQRAHEWRQQRFNIDKPAQATLVIPQGQSADSLLDDQGRPIATLPFTVALDQFWIDYHWGPATLHARYQDGRSWQIPAQPGRSLDLPDDLPTLTVSRLFHRLSVRDTLMDAPRGQPNPAALVQLQFPDGAARQVPVFTAASPHGQPVQDLDLRLELEPEGIADYFSDLVVIDPQQHSQFHYLLEVNRPLHYRGYRLFQSSYQFPAGRPPVTILTVTSDTGQGLVYAGYTLITLGAFYHFWIAPIFRQRIRKFFYGD